MLGIYKVAPGGVDVEVRITEAREDPATPAPTGPGLRASEGAPAPVEGSTRPVGRVLSDTPRWYAGALHLHTIHSDGALTPAMLSDAARDAGYDFIAITDHNNTTHTRDPLPSAPLHIVGEEVTTPGGHASVWGLPHGAWIDFRVPPWEPGAPDAINGLVAAAHRGGALFSISHPIDNCAGCSWEQIVPDGIDAVEIWQNEKAPRGGEIAFWDRLLRAGRHVTAVGVADWHRLPARIDMAASRVLAGSLTQPAILESIRGGHVIVMRDARTGPPSFASSCGSSRAGAGDSIVCAARESIVVNVSMPAFADGRAELLWNGDVADSKRIGDGASFSVPAARGYLRVHVYAADGSPLAITNPVYVEIR